MHSWLQQITSHRCDFLFSENKNYAAKNTIIPTKTRVHEEATEQSTQKQLQQ